MVHIWVGRDRHNLTFWVFFCSAQVPFRARRFPFIWELLARCPNSQVPGSSRGRAEVTKEFAARETEMPGSGKAEILSPQASCWENERSKTAESSGIRFMLATSNGHVLLTNGFTSKHDRGLDGSCAPIGGEHLRRSPPGGSTLGYLWGDMRGMSMASLRQLWRGAGPFSGIPCPYWRACTPATSSRKFKNCTCSTA